MRASARVRYAVESARVLNDLAFRAASCRLWNKRDSIITAKAVQAVDGKKDVTSHKQEQANNTANEATSSSYLRVNVAFIVLYLCASALFIKFTPIVYVAYPLWPTTDRAAACCCCCCCCMCCFSCRLTVSHMPCLRCCLLLLLHSNYLIATLAPAAVIAFVSTASNKK